MWSLGLPNIPVTLNWISLLNLTLLRQMQQRSHLLVKLNSSGPRSRGRLLGHRSSHFRRKQARMENRGQRKRIGTWLRRRSVYLNLEILHCLEWPFEYLLNLFFCECLTDLVSVNPLNVWSSNLDRSSRKVLLNWDSVGILHFICVPQNFRYSKFTG